VLTCGFACGIGWICVLIGLVVSGRGCIHAHGEDRVGGDGGPDSALLSAELEALKAAAKQRLMEGQVELNLGLDTATGWRSGGQARLAAGAGRDRHRAGLLRRTWRVRHPFSTVTLRL
jgi:hypothetical protein